MLFNNYYSQKGKEKVTKSTIFTDGIMVYSLIFTFSPLTLKNWGELLVEDGGNFVKEL